MSMPMTRRPDAPGLSRWRIWASKETLSWVDWLRDETGERSSSRIVQRAIELLTLCVAERGAGRVIISCRPDGSDPREIK